MRFGSNGAVIAAHNNPLMTIGSIPVLRRLVLSMQMAGIFPIVVVTGAETAEVVHLLSDLGIIFINNPDDELFSYVRLGLDYLLDKCDRVFFSPVSYPLFLPQTLTTLLSSDADVVTPLYDGRGGHPVLIKNSVIREILSYNGDEGLRGALETPSFKRERIEVDDRGILLSTHNGDEIEKYVPHHNDSLLSPSVKVSIDKENVILNSRLNLLLFLISDMGSIRQAAIHMGLSYQKAWEMINTLEKELGYKVMERRRGGKDGGKTSLTEKGKKLMYAFQSYEEELHVWSEKRFKEIFMDGGLI